MNCYDFDQTVFFPDSSYCFFLYCLRHYPRAVLASLPATAVTGIRCLQKKTDTRALKEKVFAFLPMLDDVDRIVAEFWEENRCKVADWYLQQKEPDDVIISASPEFLLRPICDELGVQLIATPMDRYTGRILGANCHDKEKVRRFYRDFPNGHVEKFYSDSLSDTPMAQIADKAYLVKNGERILWPLL